MQKQVAERRRECAEPNAAERRISHRRLPDARPGPEPVPGARLPGARFPVRGTRLPTPESRLPGSRFPLSLPAHPTRRRAILYNLATPSRRGPAERGSPRDRFGLCSRDPISVPLACVRGADRAASATGRRNAQSRHCMTTPHTRIADIVKTARQPLLEGWLATLREALGDGRIANAELTQQATELLGLITPALEIGHRRPGRRLGGDTAAARGDLAVAGGAGLQLDRDRDVRLLAEEAAVSRTATCLRR